MKPAVALFVVFLLSNMATPIFALWEAELGFPTALITVLFALYQGGVLVGLFGLAPLTARFGLARSLVGGIGSGIAAAALFATATSFWQVAAGRLLVGVAVGVFLSSGAAAVNVVLERRGSTNGPLLASCCISAGVATGPLVAGLAADNLPWPTRLVFIAAAVLLGGAGVLVGSSRSLRAADRAATATASADRPRSGLSAGPATGDQSGSQSAAAPVRALLPERDRRRAVAVATATLASCYVTCAIFMSIGPSYFAEVLGRASGTLSGAVAFLVFSGALLAQVAAKRASSRTVAAWGLGVGIVAAVGVAAGVATGGIALLVAAAFLSGASQGLGQLTGFTVVRNVTPLPLLRSAYGRLNAIGYAAGGGTILLTAPLIASSGVETAIVVIAAAVTVASLVTTALLIAWGRTWTVPAAPAPVASTAVPVAEPTV